MTIAQRVGTQPDRRKLIVLRERLAYLDTNAARLGPSQSEQRDALRWLVDAFSSAIEAARAGAPPPAVTSSAATVRFVEVLRERAEYISRASEDDRMTGAAAGYKQREASAITRALAVVLFPHHSG